jgi:hypothetical protein
MSNEPRQTYDKPRRSDAVGLLTALRDDAVFAAEMQRGEGAHSTHWALKASKYRAWARWVKAVLESGGGGE